MTVAHMRFGCPATLKRVSPSSSAEEAMQCLHEQNYNKGSQKKKKKKKKKKNYRPLPTVGTESMYNK